MKKGLRMTAVALTAVALLTGCGSSSKDVALGTATEEKFTDMSKGESVEAQAVTTAFTDALTQAESADSATINTNVNIELTEDGETTSTQQDINIKYAITRDESDDDTDATKDDSASENTIKASDVRADFNITNKYNGEENVTDAYFENGMLYYEYDGKKVKEEADYADLMSTVANYTIGFNEDAVESAVKVESSDETKYIIKFDSEAMAEMMMNNNVAGSQTEDESISINSAYLYFVVDNSNAMLGFNMEIDADFTSAVEATETETADEAQSTETQTKTSPFKYSLAANFTNLNTTEVTAFENLDEYEDINTVLENMSNEAATATEATTEN
jgi:hypothetical protein